MIEIVLQDASNLRDIGGVAAGSRVVRLGLVFRAPALGNLSDADRAVVGALGIRTLCDFRGVRERMHNPVLIEGAESLSLPIEPSVGAGLRDILRTGQASGHMSPEDMMALLRDAYRAYALESAGQYRRLFSLLLEHGRLPLLLHCSAGKDRTGFGVALLLTALGVAWEDVVADYLATNRLWRREIARNFDLPEAVKDVLLGAHRPLLEAAFEALREGYGSVDEYLAGPIGLDGAGRVRLAELLLQG